MEPKICFVYSDNLSDQTRLLHMVDTQLNFCLFLIFSLIFNFAVRIYPISLLLSLLGCNFSFLYAVYIIFFATDGIFMCVFIIKLLIPW